MSQLFMLILKCDHPFLCEFPVLFSTMKLKLGNNFSHFIKFGFWNVGLGLCILPSFFKFTKEMEN